MRFRLGGLIISFLLILGGVGHSEIDFKLLTGTKSLQCTYFSRSYGHWSDGKVSTGIGQAPLESGVIAELTFTSIDRIAGKAILKTEWGDDEVSILTTAKGLTFLENSSTGNLIMVTVFPYYCSFRKAYCSVLSEHSGSGGKAFPSQSYGFCEPRNTSLGSE